MKRINIHFLPVVLCLCTLLLIGCETNTKSAKINDELMNKFPSDTQELLKEVNPDLVSMEYLVENSDKYETEIGSDRNDFFVVVKGTVTKIESLDYSKEDLSIMENRDAAELLKNTISYDIFLDDTAESLNASIQQGESEPNIELGKEYYFFVNVPRLGDFNIIDYFNLN